MLNRMCQNLVQLNESQLSLIVSSMLNDGLTAEIVLRASSAPSLIVPQEISKELRAVPRLAAFTKIRECDWLMRLALCELSEIFALTSQFIEMQPELPDVGLELTAMLSTMAEIKIIKTVKEDVNKTLLHLVDNASVLDSLQTILDILFEPHLSLDRVQIIRLPWSCRMLQVENERANSAKPVVPGGVVLQPLQRRTFLGDSSCSIAPAKVKEPPVVLLRK